MLVIRPQQNQDLARRSRQRFEEQAMEALARLWPEALEQLGLAGLRRRLRLELERGAFLGLLRERDLVWWVSFTLLWAELAGAPEPPAWAMDVAEQEHLDSADKLALLAGLTSQRLVGRIQPLAETGADPAQVQRLLGLAHRVEGPGGFSGRILGQTALPLEPEDSRPPECLDFFGAPETCRLERLELRLDGEGQPRVELAVLPRRDPRLATLGAGARQGLAPNGVELEITAPPWSVEHLAPPALLRLSAPARRSFCQDRGHPLVTIYHQGHLQPAARLVGPGAGSGAISLPLWAAPEPPPGDAPAGPSTYLIQVDACRGGPGRPRQGERLQVTLRVYSAARFSLRAAPGSPTGLAVAKRPPATESMPCVESGPGFPRPCLGELQAELEPAEAKARQLMARLAQGREVLEARACQLQAEPQAEIRQRADAPDPETQGLRLQELMDSRAALEAQQRDVQGRLGAAALAEATQGVELRSLLSRLRQTEGKLEQVQGSGAAGGELDKVAQLRNRLAGQLERAEARAAAAQKEKAALAERREELARELGALHTRQQELEAGLAAGPGARAAAEEKLQALGQELHRLQELLKLAAALQDAPEQVSDELLLGPRAPLLEEQQPLPGSGLPVGPGEPFSEQQTLVGSGLLQELGLEEAAGEGAADPGAAVAPQPLSARPEGACPDGLDPGGKAAGRPACRPARAAGRRAATATGRHPGAPGRHGAAAPGPRRGLRGPGPGPR